MILRAPEYRALLGHTNVPHYYVAKVRHKVQTLKHSHQTQKSSIHTEDAKILTRYNPFKYTAARGFTFVFQDKK